MSLETPEMVRRAGLAALRKELGVVGMIRFMQQFEPGTGDYTADRWQWLDENATVAELMRAAKELEAQATAGN